MGSISIPAIVAAVGASAGTAGTAAGASAIAAGVTGLSGAAAATSVGILSAGTLANLGLATSLIGGVTGAVGAYASGQAQASASKFNAKLAAQNSAQELKNAGLTDEAGAVQSQNQSLKARAELGSIKANEAASGIDVNSGSAVDVRSSAKELGELNALTVRSNATKQAYGQEVQSVNDAAQSTLDKQEGSASLAAGSVGAASTLLGTAGNATDNYAKWQLNSGFSY